MDLISARFAEVQGGADQLGALNGNRQNLLDEEHTRNTGLGDSWSDAVYDTHLVNHQQDYNFYTEDIALNEHTRVNMDNYVVDTQDMQQRCISELYR
jgi:hypothetical protein